MEIINTTPEKYMEDNDIYHNVNIDQLYNTAAEKAILFLGCVSRRYVWEGK